MPVLSHFAAAPLQEIDFLIRTEIELGVKLIPTNYIITQKRLVCQGVWEIINLKLIINQLGMTDLYDEH